MKKTCFLALVSMFSLLPVSSYAVSPMPQAMLALCGGEDTTSSWRAYSYVNYLSIQAGGIDLGNLYRNYPASEDPNVLIYSQFSVSNTPVMNAVYYRNENKLIINSPALKNPIELACAPIYHSF